VSDFLGRIAARAVGEAALAQPRLPALFEQAGSAETFGPGIVDEEVVVPASAREVQAGGARHPALETRPREAREPHRTADVTHERENHVLASVPTASEPQIAESPKPSDTLSLGVGEAPPLPPPPVPSASPERPSVAASAAVVPAAPAIRGVRLPEPSTPAGVPEEQPAVRVHIGRLEVRANLQDAAPRPQPRPAESRPQGLSLSDYLRGKREAG
jgi:hypothetical protein